MAEEDETFFIGRFYEDCAATTLACKKCGGKSFNVGQSSYITVIKCISCDWQLDIHNG
jgi:ribosomal protein L37E